MLNSWYIFKVKLIHCMLIFINSWDYMYFTVCANLMSAIIIIDKSDKKIEI